MSSGFFRTAIFSIAFAISLGSADGQQPKRPIVPGGDTTKRKEIEGKIEIFRPTKEQTDAKLSEPAVSTQNTSEDEKRHVANIKNYITDYKKQLASLNTDLDKIKPLLDDINTLEGVSQSLQGYIDSCQAVEAAETRTIVRKLELEKKSDSTREGSITFIQLQKLRERLVNNVTEKRDCYRRLAQTRDTHRRALVEAINKHAQIDFIFAEAKEDKAKLDRLIGAIDNEILLLQAATVTNRGIAEEAKPEAVPTKIQ